jgi:hypothetical protein
VAALVAVVATPFTPAGVPVLLAALVAGVPAARGAGHARPPSTEACDRRDGS